MINRSELIKKNIYSNELNTEIKYFFPMEKIQILRSEVKEGSVLLGMEYRPDKLAAYYLGDESLGWVLDYTNGFFGGIKDYYLGRKILIPSQDSIMEIL